MKLYKLENDTLKKYNGGFVVFNNRIYTNPTEEIVRKAGYKDVVYSDMPEYDIETQCLSLVYEETDGKIKASWEVKEMEAVSYVNDN